MIYDEICFKELAYMVTEAEKSKLCSLQAADIRRPRKANGMVSVSAPKSEKFQLEDRRRLMSHLKDSHTERANSPFLPFVYSGLQWIRWAH